MSKPVAVLTADVHYNINTLTLADAGMRQAIAKANELEVPFVVAGDLHDSKALLRAECIKAMIETFSLVKTRAIVIIGNHCLVNQKAKEHALEFLKPYAEVVQVPMYDAALQSWLIPYQHDAESMKELLSTIEPGSRIICHTGIVGAEMGHYIQDPSAVEKDAFADFRVISGHYHRRQDIKCGRPRKGAVGLFSYIGNPYTLSFGEAWDPEKGFSILHENGLLTHVPTNLRKHVVTEVDSGYLRFIVPKADPKDLVWLKVTGPRSKLDLLDKEAIGDAMMGHSNFKLDKIYTDAAPLEADADKLSGEEILDKLIDNLPDSIDEKVYLKQLWRELLETA